MNASSAGPGGGGRPSSRRLYDRLVRFLVRERTAGSEQLADVHSLPIEERIEAGECVAGLKFRREERDGRLLFDCPENISKFRQGDKVGLGTGENPAEVASAEFDSYDAATRTLGLRRDSYEGYGWDELDLSRPLVIDRRGSDFGSLALQALEVVYGQDDGRSRRVRGILERSARQVVDGAEEDRAEAAAKDFGLDPSQREAFVGACAKREFHMVQGPPGSGKTHLLACLANHWVAAGERILVTAQTHRAVNNVLRAAARLDEAGRLPRPVKIGQAYNAEDLPDRVERVEKARQLPPPAEGRGQLVGGTLFALKTLWSQEQFDRVVFDEAAQIPLPFAVCGMLTGRRYVFVGDHRQLGPIVQGEHGDPIAGLSVFEHLLGIGAGDGTAGDGRYEATLLRTTYRMNAGINEFPSRVFYGGELKSSAGCAGRQFRPRRAGAGPGADGPLDRLLAPEPAAVLATIAHEGCLMRSAPEARLVADLLAALLTERGLDPDEVAVLTPFRAQIRVIESLLQTRFEGAGGGLPVVDTVERLQGQEREVVIVSLTCSEPEYAARKAEFFFSPNRLNVMLTRARTKLIVIASPILFSALPSELESLRQANLFARLYRELSRIDLTHAYLPASRPERS